MNRTFRTFVAVNISQDIRDKISNFQNQLKSLGGDIKWVRPNGIHITLKFLGDVSETRIQSVGTEVRKAVLNESPFSILVDGCGGFPNLRKPRVLWVGIKEGGEKLSLLAKKVDLTLSQLGFEREKRSYSAHLTLGRIRSLKNIHRVTEPMQADPFHGGNVTVNTIHVMKSDLQPTGAVYTALETLKLEGNFHE